MGQSIFLIHLSPSLEDVNQQQGHPAADHPCCHCQALLNLCCTLAGRCPHHYCGCQTAPPIPKYLLVVSESWKWLQKVMMMNFLLLWVMIGKEVANECISKSNIDQCQLHINVPFLEAMQFCQ
jgi:hypothetical protein